MVLPAELDPKNIKGTIVAIILGVIMLIIGGVASDVTAAIGKFIIVKLNGSAGGALVITTNFLGDIVGIVSPVFTFLGIAFIIIAAVFILRQMLAMTQSMSGAAE